METGVLEELRRSPSFLSWSPDSKPTKPATISLGHGRSFTHQGKSYKNVVVDEKHFSPADLAKAWGVPQKLFDRSFVRTPGSCVGSTGDKRTRGYVTLRIPQSSRNTYSPLRSLARVKTLAEHTVITGLAFPPG